MGKEIGIKGIKENAFGILGVNGDGKVNNQDTIS